MIDKMYRWIDGVLILLLAIALTKVVTEFTQLFMPEGVIETENAVRASREISNMYYQGSSALMDYLIHDAFIEEIFFRFLPILLFAKWVRSNNEYTCNPRAVRTIAVVGICSIIFGLIHGGFWNIFVQGAYGVAFSTVFIYAVNKLPASFGRVTKSVLGLGVSTLVHAFSNYAIIMAANYQAQ